MGLDISTYRKLVLANGNEAFDETGELKYEEGWHQMFVNHNFPSQADGIEDGKAYRGEEGKGFRAGSYGGYNRWRETLASIAGYTSPAEVWDNPKPGPFFELVNFSDCEGVIGPDTSRKLAKDFADFYEKAKALGDEYFFQKYEEWKAAFEFASDSGAVCFH